MFAWIIRLLRRLFPEKTIRCCICGREFPAELIADVDLCGPCEVQETLTGWCDDCNHWVWRCTCPEPCEE
jgi:hypothetical protein